MTTGESIRAQDQAQVRVREDAEMPADDHAAAIDGARDASGDQVPGWRDFLTQEEAKNVASYDVQIGSLTRQRRELADRRKSAIDRWDRKTAQELRDRINALDRLRRATASDRQLIVNRGTARKRKKERQCRSTAQHQTVSSLKD